MKKKSLLLIFLFTSFFSSLIFGQELISNINVPDIKPMEFEWTEYRARQLSMYLFKKHTPYDYSILNGKVKLWIWSNYYHFDCLLVIPTGTSAKFECKGDWEYEAKAMAIANQKRYEKHGRILTGKNCWQYRLSIL